MCDPLTLGALAVGTAGTVANTMGQQSALQKQEDEYNQWAELQRTNRAAETARQEEYRQSADAARQKGVEEISAENQKAQQAAEEERLKAYLAGEAQTSTPNPDTEAATSVADARLTGTTGGGDVFQSDLAKQLSDATASAKQRIGALARVQSYGGSEKGLGTVNPLAQAEAGAGIDQYNDYRRGSLGAYDTERAVEPKQISYSNPIAEIASGFLGAGMQGLGSSLAGGTGLGSLFGSASTVVPQVTLPATAPIPVARIF